MKIIEGVRRKPAKRNIFFPIEGSIISSFPIEG